MIIIKNEYKLAIIIVALCVLLAITATYPQYLGLWDFLFGLTVVYTFIKTFFGKKPVSKKIKDNKLLIICLVVGIIVGIFEMLNGSPLMFSVAIFILGLLGNDIILN